MSFEEIIDELELCSDFLQLTPDEVVFVTDLYERYLSSLAKSGPLELSTDEKNKLLKLEKIYL